MTKQEKELLLKDLCARLPFEVQAEGLYEEYDDNDEIIQIKTYGVITGIFRDIVTIGINNDCKLVTVKPYLRPLSSMTKEECRELQELCDMYDPYHDTDPYDDWGIHILTQYVHSDVPKTVLTNFDLVLDWFNEHYFDYRGLIPMGLALPAPKGMYK